jgi:hypothetical protein
MDLTILDGCPLPLQNNKLNVQNHLYTIANHGLGPTDPRQPNEEFWKQKAVKWGCTEGDARGRLCANCEYYVNTTQIQDCIANGPAYELKASQLPITPKWADIESHPMAYCVKFDITCSPVRTCDEQEMGGPIDDERMAAKQNMGEGFDVNEGED